MKNETQTGHALRRMARISPQNQRDSFGNTENRYLIIKVKFAELSVLLIRDGGFLFL